MSLEELRNDWDAIGESTNPNKLSKTQIKAILKSKFRSFINRILILEILMLFVYLYFMALTIFRFDELEIIYLEILAIISIAMLAGLFIIRVIKLKDTYRNRFLLDSHSIAFEKIAKQKVKIQKFYLVNIISGFLLIVVLIILNIKIYSEYDLVQSKNFWLTIIPASFIFMVLINKWIRKYYTTVILEAENLLQEIK